MVDSTVRFDMEWPFKEVIPVYPENDTKPINTLCGQSAELLNVKAGGAYNYHSA
jgi:hypothetical protein